MFKRMGTLFPAIGRLFGFNPPESEFKSCLPVFRTEQGNRRRERMTQLHHRRQQLAATHGVTGTRDPISGRYELYREHADNLGKDFIDDFLNIIAAHCSYVSKEPSNVLFVEFHDMYKRAIDDAKRADSALAHSLGRPNDIESMFQTH